MSVTGCETAVPRICNRANKVKIKPNRRIVLRRRRNAKEWRPENLHVSVRIRFLSSALIVSAAQH